MTHHTIASKLADRDVSNKTIQVTLAFSRSGQTCILLLVIEVDNLAVVQDVPGVGAVKVVLHRPGSITRRQ